MTKSNTGSFTLTDNQTGKSYDLPVLHASVGPSVVDVRKFYAETDHFTYDPGFTSTGSCESGLTYIDGDKGILLHRGYRIEDLAANCSFLEVAHLLLNGDLPNKEQKAKFDHDVTYHTMVHEQISNFSCAASAGMRTRWPSSSAWWVHCLHFITTQRTSMIRINAGSPAAV